MAPAPPTLAQLRPALEHALAAARSFEPARRGIVPGTVQGLIKSRSRTPPPNWAATLRLAIEEDPVFRAEVAGSASEQRIGRLGWLWLARPEGWSSDMAAVTGVDGDEVAGGSRSASSGQLLAVLERRLAKAERDLTRVKATNADLTGDVTRLRRTVTELEMTAKSASESSVRLETEGRELRSKLDRADKEVERWGTANRRLQEQQDRLRDRAATLTASIEQSSQLLARSEDQRESARSQAQKLQAELDQIRAAKARTLAQATKGALQLLDLLRSAVDPPDRPGSEPVASAPPTPEKGPKRDGRHPTPLPPGILDDSVEAASLLVRRPGVRLIVDGYNVALTSWSERDLPVLRDRLVHALAEVVLRHKISVEVIFDGTAEGGRVPPPATVRSRMTVLFSASDVEADVEIIAAVERMESRSLVVVATDDKVVREAAGRRGANVIGVHQLLGAIGRQPNAPRRPR